MSLRIATWNVERSGTRHRLRVPAQQAHLESLASDVYVLTECHDGLALEGCVEPVLSAAGQAPYERTDRAVGIWSKWPVVRSLETSDCQLSACAEIASPLGPLLVYGTILPYHAADKPEAGHWERHREALVRQIDDWHRLRANHPRHLMCVAGDFNMNLDGRRWYGDRASRTKLLAALEGLGMRCVTTADWYQSLGRSSIDHICISSNLAVSGDARAWPGTSAGRRLSDHNGVVVDLGTVNSAEVAVQALLAQFHALIRARVNDLMPAITQLPAMPTSQDLVVTLASDQGWYPIPGMYGGFAYQLLQNDSSTMCLRVSSWSRVIAGSSRAHEITVTGGARLVDEEDGPEVVPAA